MSSLFSLMNGRMDDIFSKEYKTFFCWRHRTPYNKEILHEKDTLDFEIF